LPECAISIDLAVGIFELAAVETFDGSAEIAAASIAVIARAPSGLLATSAAAVATAGAGCEPSRRGALMSEIFSASSSARTSLDFSSAAIGDAGLESSSNLRFPAASAGIVCGDD